MFMNMGAWIGIAVIAGIALVAFLIVALVLKSWIKVARADEALVISGKKQSSGDSHSNVAVIVNGKAVVNKFQNVIVHHINSGERQDGSENADQNTLDDKGSTHKEIRRPDVLHDIDFFLPDRNTDRDRIVDQEHGYQNQNDDDPGRNICNQSVYAGQRACRKRRLVHLPYFRNGLQIGHQLRLLGNILHKNLIAG